MKYIKQLEEQFKRQNYPVFRSYELDSFGVGKKYRKRLLHLMLSNRKIKRITRGVYTFHDDVNVVGFAFAPFYYGFEDALSIRGISDQGTNPIVVTIRNVRRGRRVFEGRNYIVRHIPEEQFFGYGMVRQGNLWVPVSDVEKTIIDMLYFDDYIRDELWPGILKELNRERLRAYLQKYKKDLRNKVENMVKESKSVVR
jgi:predicted transcriptional regulator of viral defense system